MVVGVDVGGTKFSAAVVDDDGRMLGRVKVPASRELGAVADAASEAVRRADIAWDAISAVGVCVPGIYFMETGHAWAPNLWGWDEVPLRDELAARLPAPVAIDSDRSAYVLGEQWLGAARGLDDVVFLAVGTGIGAGVISGGRVIRGASGIAGAVGWMTLEREHDDGCAQTGCFESHAAGPAVARRGGAADAETVVARARTGDAAALAVLRETAVWLAAGVANLISVFNPHMVVLGGGLMQAGDLLLDEIRREVPLRAQPLAARQTRIELTQLGEDAGLVGAARLAQLRLNSD